MGAPRSRSAAPRAGLYALSAVTGVAGLLLAATAPAVPDLVAPPFSAAFLVALWALLFMLAEYTRVHLEVRDYALSLSFSDVPLVLALFTVDVWPLLAARIVAVGLTMLHRRVAPHKAVFNLSAYAAETGLAYWAAGHLLDGQRGFADNVAPVFTVFVLLAVLGTATVTAAIWLLDRRPTALWCLQVLAAVVASGLLSASIGVLTLPILDDGIGALAPLSVVVVTLMLVFSRGATMMQERSDHKDLLAAVREISRAANALDVEAALVKQASGLLRAQNAQVLIGPETDGLPHGGGTAMILSAGDNDEQTRAWLAAQGCRDAVIAPMDMGRHTSGALVIRNRRGPVEGFRARDRWIAETLAEHTSLVATRHRLTGRLMHEATHDHLTRLPNRRAFTSVVDRALEESSPPEQSETPLVAAGLVLLVVDLDRFRAVNDVLGHPAGDRLLTLVARRLEDVIPTGAVLAHYGGDEFAVCLPRATKAEAEALAVALAASLEPTFAVSGSVVDVTVSIGLAAAVDSTDADAATLLRQVDIALFTAKDRDSRRAWYSRDADRSTPERLGLVGQLRRAIHEDQIALVFQPKVRLADGVVTGFEALARWQHPTRGQVRPDEFVALAQQSGQLRDLTMLTLRKAIEACVTWPQPVGVAVNLPPSVLGEPSLPAEIASMATEFGLLPARLTLELTESTLMTYQRDTTGPLDVLCAYGVHVSIDDFGTGYSSLAYLRQLPVSEVKIDKAFMQGVPGSPAAAVLVRSIADVAHALDLTVVAEGVEDPCALETLQELGCDLVQGFVMSPPLEPERVLDWLTARGQGPDPAPGFVR